MLIWKWAFSLADCTHDNPVKAVVRRNLLRRIYEHSLAPNCADGNPTQVSLFPIWEDKGKRGGAEDAAKDKGKCGRLLCNRHPTLPCEKTARRGWGTRRRWWHLLAGGWWIRARDDGWWIFDRVCGGHGAAKAGEDLLHEVVRGAGVVGQEERGAAGLGADFF